MAGALACATVIARAHWVQPEQVIAQLRVPALRQAFGITEVTRHPDLPRMLVIRVGPRWTEVAAPQRRAAAERWRHLWRHSVPQGILAILDAATDRSLINFDAEGRAMLRGAPAGVPHGRAP